MCSARAENYASLLVGLRFDLDTYGTAWADLTSSPRLRSRVWADGKILLSAVVEYDMHYDGHSLSRFLPIETKTSFGGSRVTNVSECKFDLAGDWMFGAGWRRSGAENPHSRDDLFRRPGFLIVRPAAACTPTSPHI